MSPALRDGLGRRALELAVLCAFAFAQPLFDLLGRNPEFFAVRGSPSGDIVLFAVGLVLLPPLVLTGVEALAGLAGPRARDAVHAVLVALLGALIAIQVVKRIGALPAGLDLAFALAVGLALAWALALRRGRVARTFVTVLSPAPLLFLALFLLGSRATQLVLAEHAEVATAGARPGAPVVMVVFDEFPVTSLLDRDGRIDRVRYPSFATLAGALDVVLARDDGVRLHDACRARDPRRASAPEGLAAHAGPAPAQPLHAPRPVLPPQRLRGGHAAVPTVAVPERRPAGPGAATALAGLRLRGRLRPPRRCRRRSRTACPRSRRAGATSTAATRGGRGARAAGRRRPPGALRSLGALDPPVVAHRR